jgi:hypothetical protein
LEWGAGPLVDVLTHLILVGTLTLHEAQIELCKIFLKMKPPHQTKQIVHDIKYRSTTLFETFIDTVNVQGKTKVKVTLYLCLTK